MVGSSSSESGNGSEHDCSRKQDVFRCQLTVEIDPNQHREILCQPSDVEVVRHEIKPCVETECMCGDIRGKNGIYECGECHTELRGVGCGSGELRYYVTGVRRSCICPVLAGYEGLTELGTITSEVVTVRATVPGRDGFEALLDTLRSRSPSLSIDWVVWNDDKTSPQDSVCDVTNRQREAVEIALAMGYYDTPREATLGDLADRLDISESAVSQRLNAVETNLVTSFFDRRTHSTGFT